MTAREKAPTILTAEGARKLTARIRDALSLADDLLVRAWEGRVWEALGHDSWDAYCKAELPGLRMLRLSVPDRRGRVASMREAGMSTRAIGSALGVSEATVRGDLAGVDGPASVTSLDGRTRPARGARHARQEVDPYTGMTRTEETLARVTAQADRGLTSIELDHETGWPMGTATGTLCRLERRGLIRRVPVFRMRRAAYVRS